MNRSLKPHWREKLGKTRQKEEVTLRPVILQSVITALVTILLASVPMAGFTYYLASLAEKQKEVSAEERLFLEQRMKVFIATGEHFEAYQQNWSRLISFAKYEWERLKKKEPLTEKEQENKKKYWIDRDKAKDSLYADLRSVRLFFSHEVTKLIDDFRKFDGEQNDKRSTWRHSRQAEESPYGFG